MYQNCCKKCGSLDLHTKVKGNNTGLYCSDCGAYIKWLSKDELRAFENVKKQEVEVSATENNTDVNFIKQELNDLIEFLNDQIDKEMSRRPLSNEDSIAKCSTALAYEKDKNAISNILNGRHWNELPE